MIRPGLLYRLIMVIRMTVIKNIGHDGSGDADQENRSEEGDRAGQDEAVTIVVDEEFQAATANKLKGKKNKRRVVGASGSDHPPKKLREDHGTSGNVGASTGGKSLVALQGLLEGSTLAVEVGVMAAAIMPFVTSFVTPTTNVADAEVASLVRSFVPPPPVMTAAVTTTNVVGASSALVLGAGADPVSQVHPSIFDDSASIGATGPDVLGPSNPASTELSADTFYVSQEMDTETLHQIYVPKWNVVNESVLDDPNLFAEFNVGAARQTCLSIEVDLLKERDVEIANLKAQLFLKETEATKAIHLRNQVSVVETVEASRVSELNSLKERNSALEEEKNALEGKVATLKFATAAKETELASLNAQTAKLTQDLSSLELSCDEFGVKVASLESQRDGFVDQVKALSDRMARLDSKLLALALHLDEEFYPCFLTTIAGRQ
ncbi:hypothetical protein Tco_1170038 [Tanacetum coccineum]